MRVLALLTDAFGGRGGIALYARNLLSALCQRKPDATVIALPRIIVSTPTNLPRNLEYDSSAASSKLHFGIALLRALIRPGKYDLIVCTHINLIPLALLARTVLRAPVILFIYGREAWTKRRGSLAYNLVHKVDAVVSIRPYTLDRMKVWAQCMRAQHYILENAIDPTHYGPGLPPRELQERYGLVGKRVLMTLGRLDDERYGVDELLEVMPDLAQITPDLVYVVVGGGSQLERLRSKARSLGVAGSVVFVGEIPEEQKVAYLRLADVFAMPGSHPRTFDRYPARFSFLEAMACGLPIVASEPEELTLGGAIDVPNINVDPNDRASIISGVSRALLHGKSKEIGPELGRYSVPEFRKSLDAIIDDVIQKYHG